MDYLALLNGLARSVKPAGSAFRPAEHLEVSLPDTGLDSLDITLLAVYVCEVFGIPEEVGKTLVPGTFADIVRFVGQHATRMPESVEAALATVAG
jgi:hypothetical protein